MERTDHAQPPADPDAEIANKQMRDRDVLFAIVLIAGSVAVIVYSLVISLQAMQTLQIRFYTAPGFFVLLIGCALLILGAVLLLTALRQGGDVRWLAPDSLTRIARSRPARQTTIVFVYLFLYMWLFWGEVPWVGWPVPFWLGTFLFLFVMLITFTQKRWYSLAAISAVAALLIDTSFRFLAKVPLP